MVRYESVEEKDANSAICTKIRSGGGQYAQNETCARLSKSNSNENLDGFFGRLACNRLACQNQRAGERVRKVACLFGFLLFFGLLLNSRNNLFAEPSQLTKVGDYYHDAQGVKYDLWINGYGDNFESGALVIGYQFPNGINDLDVIIPNKVVYKRTISGIEYEETFNVTGINNDGFKDCEQLTSITIPDSVTSIEASVFSGCSSLSNITVGAGNVNYIAYDNVLYEITSESTVSLNCFPGGHKTGEEKTTNFNVPEKISGKYKVESIEDCAFYGCSSLESVVIPEGVTSIGNDAFAFCGITEIDLSGCVSLDSIGVCAFYECYNLQTVNFPASLDSIGYCAFSKCSSLQLVTVSGDYTLEYNWEGYSRYTVKFQDGATPAKTLMTQIVFINNRTTAADPAEYGIVVMGEEEFWSEDGTSAFNFLSTIGKDLTLKATGSIGYVVTFEPAEGKWGDETADAKTFKVESGLNLSELEALKLTKENYVFMGWFDKAHNKVEVVTGPTTLTAKWIEVVHLVFSKVFTGNVDIAEAFLSAGATDKYDEDKIKAFFEKNFQLYRAGKLLEIGADVSYDSDKIEEYISASVNDTEFTFTVKMRVLGNDTYTIKELTPKDNIYKAENPEVTFVIETE